MDIEMPNSGKTGCGRTMEREFPPELESFFRFFIKIQLLTLAVHKPRDASS